MIALIIGGIFILALVAILVLMLRAPLGREIPGVGFVREDPVRRRMREWTAPRDEDMELWINAVAELEREDERWGK